MGFLWSCEELSYLNRNYVKTKIKAYQNTGATSGKMAEGVNVLGKTL